MKVLIFGATGLVGQCVLRECLTAKDVEHVVAVGRTRTNIAHPRLSNVIRPDLTDLRPVASRLSSFDACFFCLGISSVGMNEAEYTKVTYGLTMSVAQVLVKANPSMTFVYVTGAAADTSERGKTMWARVKGKTENDLMKLGFRAAYMFRPGIILPLHAVQATTSTRRFAYFVARPFFRILHAVSPRFLVTSVEVGLAMLSVARHGYPRQILQVTDIQIAARGA